MDPWSRLKAGRGPARAAAVNLTRKDTGQISWDKKNTVEDTGTHGQIYREG